MQIDMFNDPNKLSNEKIREELTKTGISQELIDSIIEQFWFHDPYNSFIAIPGHFEILEQFLKSSNYDTFSRFDFYYYFFEKAVRHPRGGFILTLRDYDQETSRGFRKL